MVWERVRWVIVKPTRTWKRWSDEACFAIWDAICTSSSKTCDSLDALFPLPRYSQCVLTGMQARKEHFVLHSRTWSFIFKENHYPHTVLREVLGSSEPTEASVGKCPPLTPYRNSLSRNPFQLLCAIMATQPECNRRPSDRSLADHLSIVDVSGRCHTPSLARLSSRHLRPPHPLQSPAHAKTRWF